MKAFIYGYGSIGKRHHKILQQIFPKLSMSINDNFIGHNSEPNEVYDIGLVCSDTVSHLECANKLINKCGIVFIEKPLHVSMREIEKYTNFSNANIHVGCNVRYTNAINSLKQISSLSKIVRITSMSNLLKWRNDPERKSYSFHKNKGGGVLMDFIHEPDYARHVFGNPLNVQLTQTRLYDSTVDSDDSCAMIWQYQDKIVSFHLSYCSNSYVRKIEVLDRHMNEVTFDIKKEDIELSYVRQWEDVLKNGPQNSYNDCVELYSKILEG